MPAIVDRGDVVVAVGTGGSSPVVARRVREKIEALLPARIGDLAGFIGRWRKPTNALIAHAPLRRRFWDASSTGRSAPGAGGLGAKRQALDSIDDPSAYAGAP